MKKVEQHIINKTNKPSFLRFWVEGGACESSSYLIIYGYPWCSSLDFPNKWY